MGPDWSSGELRRRIFFEEQAGRVMLAAMQTPFELFELFEVKKGFFL
jgi:hypothetical protein